MRGMNTILFIALTAAVLSVYRSGVNHVSGGSDQIGCSNCDMTDPSILIIDPCFSLNSSSPCFPPEPNCLSAPLWACSFPSSFIFGTASSAYQYEGAHNIDGRGQSIWDTFAYEHPDKIEDHTTGEIAIDHYNRYKEDIARMKEIGLGAYRFSISWSRVLPNGKRSLVNQKGLTFYNSLINAIIAQGMKPFVTIFHWDLPQHLEFEYGGFLSKRVVQDFQDYAELLFETFGDRVKHWITFNEPSTYSTLGYDMGSNAPGRCSDRSRCPYGDSGTEPYTVTHNQLLAHAAAVDLYRKKFKDKQGGVIGITLVSLWVVPYNYSNYEDILAQQRVLDFQLGWFMGPLTKGSYPESMRNIVKERLPSFTPEEQEKVKKSIDFLGLNYYTAYYARDMTLDTNSAGPSVDLHVQLLSGNDEGSLGDMLNGSWIAIYPRGLMNLLVHIKHKYGNPVIYITENGLDEPNDPSLSLEEGLNRLNDTRRIQYFQCHLHTLLESINESGVRVGGYFIWSFMDNFEWASGYKTRFGIVYIDYNNNLKRHNKDSATWFYKFLKNPLCPSQMPDPMDVKEL